MTPDQITIILLALLSSACGLGAALMSKFSRQFQSPEKYLVVISSGVLLLLGLVLILQAIRVSLGLALGPT